MPPYQAPEKAAACCCSHLAPAVSLPAEQPVETNSSLRIEPEFSVAVGSEAERVLPSDNDMPHFSAYQPVAAEVSVVEPILSAATEPVPAVVVQPKAASPIKVDPSVQSRAFFPEAGPELSRCQSNH